MEFNPFVAIRLTPGHARLTGWPEQQGRVFGVLGFRTRNPTAREFVVAVRQWQHDHPPLAADGLLRLETWEMMKSEVEAYTGPIPPGTRPDWTDWPATTSDGGTVAAASTSARRAECEEDRVLQQLLREWPETSAMMKSDRFLAIPVSPEYAADNLRPRLRVLPTPGICGTLQIGQVWPGVAGGTRVIVALIPAARRFAGAVVFVTDSGQAYYQTADSWNAEFLAGLYAGTVSTLTPRQTIPEAEIQVLLDTFAAPGHNGFATALRALKSLC